MRIVADTSALLAVLLGEPDRERFHEALLRRGVVMSVVSVTETMLVLREGAGQPRSTAWSGRSSGMRSRPRA